MKDKHFFDKMVQCPRCGKWSQKTYIQQYGSCLCGEVLDEKAKFNYEMFVRCRLWRNKNYKNSQIERGKYD
jgi:hypothetical protein